ncbi:hypothetical protein [Streptomyces sp. IBSBF 2435]|uniref:hypothetical protein n=1 Tax=Streptomyces sp. IBSBF 2435 TaxID=2903531 RepID=UPI002FDC045F
MSVSEVRSPRRSAPPAALVACGLLLVPWLVILASGGAPRWTAGWLTIDSLEAVGLMASGVLALRALPHRALPPTATATAALLLLDASLDLATSQGAALLLAAAMAVLAELPLAVTCALVALSTLRAMEARNARPAEVQPAGRPRGEAGQQPSRRLPRYCSTWSSETRS